MKVCPICALRVRPGQETCEMSDGSHTHQICFDIVLAAVAADASVVVKDGDKVVFDGIGGYHVE